MIFGLFYMFPLYHLDSKHTLPQENVSASTVNVVVDGVSRVDHETVHKLHGLGPLAPQLSAHDHLGAQMMDKIQGFSMIYLATLGSRLHDKSEDTIASTPHGETANELVPQGLSLKEFRNNEHGSKRFKATSINSRQQYQLPT